MENTHPSSSSTHLPVPNPFRGLASRSTEHLITPDEKSFEKTGHEDAIRLSEEIDIGALAIGGPICAIRTTVTQNFLRGLVWSETELCVHIFDLFLCSFLSLCFVFEVSHTILVY